ncbi:hypothetical protein [Salsuginibacillus kocurii]|uniref:hypothetical protein n=1 Tax=Salsuginibacillus kocurii TaxID=427078 RepID=UPI00035FDB6F|nr:hypothetical protein [Salsuginibacillus kocurii]
MKLNILSGFLLPWLLIGSWLVRKDKQLICKMVPFGVLLSFVLNFWGDCRRYWLVYPKVKRGQFLTVMPFNLGLFPLLASLLVYCVQQSRNIGPFSWIMGFTCFTTVLEFMFVLAKRAVYGNGWDLNKTFFTYLIPFHVAYRYYLWAYRPKIGH